MESHKNGVATEFSSSVNYKQRPVRPAPHGAEPHDPGALSEDQQEKLNKFKIQSRIENEGYMRSHPEVECMMDLFLREILHEQPENVRDFASRFFTASDLRQRVDVLIREQTENVQVAKALRSTALFTESSS